MTSRALNLIAWLVGRRRRIRVVGQSMSPTLADGEFVLIDTARRPQVGELVVSRHPMGSIEADDRTLLVIKRVSDFAAGGAVVLQSDNPDAGTDSRTWGPVAPELIVGTVTVVLDRLLSADLNPPGG